MSSSMLRGFLNVLILKALAENPKSGYALIKFVHTRIGVKPSPGSVYPLLNSLHTKGIIQIKGAGRSKEYTLTHKGKQHLTSIEEKKCECMNKITEGFKMLSTITGADMQFPLTMVQSLQKGVFPFKDINPEWDNLRNNLFTMIQSGKLSKNSTVVRKVLAKANKELKRI